MRADFRFARRLTRRDFLKLGGAAVGACALAPLTSACGSLVDSSFGSERGSTTCGRTSLWYEDNNMGTAGGMPP